jgi:endoglucanase
VTAAAALLALGVSACSSPPPATRPAEGPGATAHPAAAGPDAGITFPLHTRGALIVDARGKPVKLAMVSWYGAESPGFVVGGLAYQPVGTIIREIVSMGFNGVRLPWSNQMWQQNPMVPARSVAANPRFAHEHARTIFEQVVRALANAGLMVVLDDHNSDAEWCCSLTDGNALWHNSRYPQSAWLADWKSVAAQFAGIPQVIGADLRNEPRGAATWGGRNPAVNWHAAAELGGDAVQSAAPHMLIFVEGVHSATNLSRVASLPVILSGPGHVVYEAHDYAHEQGGVISYDTFVAQIQPRWGYLAGRYPLWVGEFGTCNTAAACVNSTDPADRGLWFSVITRYLRYHNLNWSYWSLNGTKSGGLPGQGKVYGTAEGSGLLNASWDGPARKSLLAVLHAMQSPCRAGPLADGTYYIVNARSGDAIGIPGGSKANGTVLDQEPLRQAAGQRWKVTGLGCGRYAITSVLDRASMDVYGQSIRPGTPLSQWAYWGGGNQQFVIQREASGHYTFASINSMDPVGVPGLATRAAAAQLPQSRTGSASNEQWSFRRA